MGNLNMAVIILTIILFLISLTFFAITVKDGVMYDEINFLSIFLWITFSLMFCGSLGVCILTVMGVM